MSGSWSSQAIDRACSNPAWSTLLDDIYSHLQKEITHLNYSKVTELSEAEVAVLVQKRFEELNKSHSDLLQTFTKSLNEAIDDSLTTYLEEQSTKARQSNMDTLKVAVSQEVVNILDASPPEFLLSSKMFVGRPIPASLRPYIWLKSLKIPLTKLDILTFHRLAPSLDVAITRKCLQILENRFSMYSSQSNANILKTIVVNFFKKREMTISNTVESLSIIEAYIVMTIPLLISLRGDVIRRELKLQQQQQQPQPLNGSLSDPIMEYLAVDSYQWKDDDIIVKTLDVVLERLLSGAYFGGMNRLRRFSILTSSMATQKDVDDNEIFQITSVVNKAMSILEYKDSSLFHQITSLSSIENMHGTGNSLMFSVYFSNVSKGSFAFYLSHHASCGMSQLLSLENICFVWDQCFTIGTHDMLPLIIVALIFGISEELKQMKNLSNAIDIFEVYCLSLHVEALKRLLQENCSQELNEVFKSMPNSVCYSMNNDNHDKALQKIVSDFTQLK